MVRVIDNTAKRFLLLKRYPQAKVAYERALTIQRSNTSISSEQQERLSAPIYHQLGRVVQDQRQWEEAEKNYLEALRIYAHFQDQHNLGITLQSLARIVPECPGLAGRVAEILGMTADEAQELLDGLRPEPPGPKADAAAAE